MRGRLLALVIGACLVALAPPALALPALALPARGLAVHPNDKPATKPNIVVFYIDDASPTDGRLWSDPVLTPTLYDLFVAHGVRFTSSIGETPLCCPGRAGLLTGLHTHNHGVIRNDARLFNPGEHVGKELTDAGYATMWVGKYFNRDNLLGEVRWNAHGAGWTYLDAIKGVNGAFMNYALHTKTGTVAYHRYHSTRMAAERTVMHIRDTPPTTPVFAIVSLFNLHQPNVPMPGFENDPRWALCNQMPPWDPPNYNEADVSDKPAAVRALPLLPDPNGWPMTGFCREMLGVDWAAQQVRDELAADGRLDNTLFVFTADNGMGWGEHRIGGHKLYPYTTPVPLYMSWPARWGSDPRTIDEAVSNIDLAPTLCELGGCEMGPYPTGQTHADGLSLVPLLDGSVTNLERDGVLESAWAGARTWTALRTSSANPLGRWHYVEWATGGRELYDLANDPWELNNRAGDAGLRTIRATLAEELGALRHEGVEFQPDASVALAPNGRYVGDTLYAAAPSPAQTLTRSGVPQSAAVDFQARITNDGGAVDSFTVTAAISGTAPATVRYLMGSTDITARVQNGSFRIEQLAAHADANLVIQVQLGAGAPAGASIAITLTATSVKDPTRVDVVRVVAIS